MCNESPSTQNEDRRFKRFEDDVTKEYYSYNIKLRTKFLKAIDNDPFLIETCTNAIHNFNFYSFSEARVFLWKMKFTPEAVLDQLGFTTNKDDYQYVYISEDIANKLYHELRYQYSLTHEGFLKVHEIPSCQEQFTALNNAVEADIVVYFTICYICKQNCTNDYMVEKCIELVSTGEEAKIQEGLRAIGFPYMTATFVAPYAQQIADLVSALNKNYKEQLLQDADASEFVSTHEDNEEEIQEDDFYLSLEEDTPDVSDSSDTPTTETEEPNEQETSIPFTTIETLFKNRSSIKAFLRAYEDLKDHDIDGTWVIKNFYTIQALFNVADSIVE